MIKKALIILSLLASTASAQQAEVVPREILMFTPTYLELQGVRVQVLAHHQWVPIWIYGWEEMNYRIYKVKVFPTPPLLPLRASSLIMSYWSDYGPPQYLEKFPLGDINLDCKVDGADYTLWADNIGKECK